MVDAPRITLDIARPAATWPVRLRQGSAFMLCLPLFAGGSLVMLLVATCTLFRARRLYAECFARNLARLALWLHGVRLVVHRAEPWPERQVVYVANHTSGLDAFVVVALGLPNSRYFMSGFLRVILPLWIIAGLMGTFWTYRQTYPEKRRRLFRRASELLRRTGESVFLTPEGQKSWVFNRGAFHLATSLQAPIVPFFIAIPLDVDPGGFTTLRRLAVRAGEVHVHFNPAVDTSAWTVEEVDQHRLEFRSMYLAWAQELNDKSLLAREARQ